MIVIFWVFIQYIMGFVISTGLYCLYLAMKKVCLLCIEALG